MVEQGQRRQPAHPLIGIGRHLWLGRAGTQPQFSHLLEQRLRPRRPEVHPEAQPKREHVINGDRPASRDRVAVEGTAAIQEHAPLGQLREQVVNRILQSQPALLDEQQRPDGHDRLGHRRDPKDAVPAHRCRLATGQAPGDTDLDVVATRRKPGDAADAVLDQVAGHDVAQAPEALTIESAHTYPTF